MDLFDLFARIFLDTSEYEKGLGEASKTTQSFGSKLGNGLKTAAKVGAAAVATISTAAVAMGGAIVKATGAVAEHGDEIDKMSQKLGLSAEAYQQWDYVLGQAGADINSMSTGMKTLTNKLDDAKNGSADAQAMFAKLGLSMEDLNSMSREEVFENVIYGFQGMADSTERAALANDLFGRSGQELTPLFNSSIENTKELMQASKDLGMVMSDEAVKSAADYQDALDTLKRTIGGAKNSMLGDFLPAITSVMDGLTALFSGGDGTEKINEGISGIVQKISEATPKILQVGSQIILSLSEAITTNLPLLTSAASEAIITLGTGLVQQLPAIVSAGLEILVSLATGIAENLPTLIPTIVDVVLQIVDTLTQPDTLSALIDASIAIIIALANGLIAAIPQLLEKAPEIVGNLVTAIVENAPKLLKAAFELVKKIGEGIRDNFHLIVQKGGEIIGKVVSGITDGISRIWDVGMDIVRGIWKGISDGFGWIKEKISGWVGNVVSFIKGLFGIKSPSTVMRDQVGKFLALGLGQGFVDEMGNVERMMQNAMPDVAGFVDPMDFSGSGSFGGAYGGGSAGGILAEILDLLHEIRDNMGHDIVLSDGTLAGRMDKLLGRKALQKARGTI